MIKKIIERIGTVEFFCFIVILVILALAVKNTALTPNKVEMTMVDNETQQTYNESKIRYLIDDDVPARSFTQGEFGLVCLFIGIMVLTKLNNGDVKSKELTIMDVEKYVDAFVDYKILCGELQKKSKRNGGAKRSYETFVNEENGLTTKSEPVKWVAKVSERDEMGQWVSDYKVGISPYKDQIGVDEFTPITDHRLDIALEPTIIKIKKSKEEFEAKTGKKLQR